MSDSDCAILSNRVDRLGERVREMKQNGREMSGYDGGYQGNRDW
jgi:hypothetical protein